MSMIIINNYTNAEQTSAGSKQAIPSPLKPSTMQAHIKAKVKNRWSLAGSTSFGLGGDLVARGWSSTTSHLTVD